MGTELGSTGEAVTRTVVVDAHILLWFLEDSLKLSNQVAGVLADPDTRLLIPSIALAEAFWAIRKKKTMVTPDELKQAIAIDSRISVVPLDLDLVEAAQQISNELEMHD